jgi:hypothetical protein
MGIERVIAALPPLAVTQRVESLWNMPSVFDCQFAAHSFRAVVSFPYLAQSARSCDFGQVEERCGNKLVIIDG